MPATLSRDDNANQHQKLILASRVEHVVVFNDAGERIGHVSDLSIDRVSGKVVYAIVSFGGVLGLGKLFHPLPWDVLHYDPAMDGYIVNLDRVKLADAPHYSAQELEALGGPHHRQHATDIYEYYGYAAWW